MMSSIPELDISIVVPVYFNEGSLALTLSSIKTDFIAGRPGLTWEVIFVDDGSGDGSLDELQRLREQNPTTVRIVKLTRNFGQVNALLAGFSLARGACAVAISADGQDPPALINEMFDAYSRDEAEIVACARHGRDESPYRIWTSRVFYRLIRWLSFPNMPQEGFDFVLVGRRPLAALLRNPDASPFFQGQLLWTGYPIKFINYRRQARRVGKSRWTFGKKLTVLIDGVMGYSFFPIRLISFTGLVAALLGFLYALVIFVSKLVFGNPVQGWTPLMIAVLVIGGFQMLMLGVVGEYVWRTLAQVRNRDRYLIDAVYEVDGAAAGHHERRGRERVAV